MENGEDIIKIICYLLQSIDRARFVESSLSNLVNVHPGGIHKIKCNYRHANEKCETCGVRY